MERVVKSEILDSLPENHPEALRNRRDLCLINGLQQNFPWICRMLEKHLRVGDQVCEFGAGTGELGIFLRKKRIVPVGSGICGIDFWSRPRDWPEEWPWQQGDLSMLSEFPYAVVIGNHIFHQFEDSILRERGALIQRHCRVLVACEPVRRKLHLWQLIFLKPFRLSPVSWHDARVSIRAGFRGMELAELLGLSPSDWFVTTRETFFGSYRFFAIRRDRSREQVQG